MKKLWSRISFRKKIFLSLLLIIIFLSSISLLLAFYISNVDEISTNLVEEQLPEILWINHWQKEISTIIKLLELWQELNVYQMLELMLAAQSMNDTSIVAYYGEVPQTYKGLCQIITQTEQISKEVVANLLEHDEAESIAEEDITELLVNLRILHAELNDTYMDVLDMLKSEAEHINSLLKMILWTLLIGSTVALILAVFFSYRISSDLTKPIHDVNQKVKGITDGNYGLQLEEPSQIELQSLVQSINQMSLSLHESFQTLFKEKHFRERVMASIPVGIVTVNEQDNEFSVNDTAKEIVLMEQETWYQVLYEGKICRKNVEFWKWFHSKEFFLMRKITINNRKPPYERKVLVSQSPLTDQTDRVIGRIFYFVDISQIDSLEKRIYRSEKLALVGELAAGSAHEIRNPLAVIRGFIQIIDSTVDEEQRSQFQLPLVLKELDRINNIVENMLLLSKPGAPKLKKCSFKQEVLEGIMPLIHASSPEKINIHLNIESFEICVDPEQMKQVFYNMIRNSIEAIEGTGDIYIYNEIENDQVKIYFKDTGMGIPNNRDIDIFEPFISTKETGTGLGLTIIQRIVENHHGEIKLLETSANGTTFLLTLPLYN